MVAALFAFAEQHDVRALRGQAAEAVGSIAVVRIGEAVDRTGAHDRQRHLQLARQCNVAGNMHRTVQGPRGGGRALGQRHRLIGIDGIRAHVNGV